MPTVNLYGPRRITTDPLPGVRLTAAQTPESMGAGLDEANARTDEAIAGFGNTVAKVGESSLALVTQVQEKHQKEADDVVTLGAENQLLSWVEKRVRDPQTGALTVKGPDALQLTGTVGAEYDTLAGSIAQGLTTDRQKLAFEKVQQAHRLSLQQTLDTHASQEMQRYAGEELTSYVDNQRTEAIANATDPRRVGLALTSATDKLKTMLPTLGVGPEGVQAQVLKTQTATHEGVIDQLLATNQTKTAAAYFAEAHDLGQIAPDAVLRLEKALAVGQTRNAAQAISDQVLAEGGTLQEQRDKIKARADGPTRDEAMQYVEHEATVQATQQRATEAATSRQTYDILDRSHDVRQIPAPIWAGMTGAERSAAMSYADRLAKGVAVETDFSTWSGLMHQAADDPTAFATQNLLAYRAKLGDTEFKQLTEMQGAIVKGDHKKAEESIAPFRTTTEIINKTLVTYGLDPAAKVGTPQGKANAELWRLVGEQVDQLERHLPPGKKPTNEDVQGVVDHILSTSEKTPGSWWGLVPFSGASFFAKDQRVLNLTIADVPATQRTLIETQLRQAGRAVSDATILDAYQSMLVRAR